MATTSTPLFAVVGATDLAVERVRAAAANASVVQAQFEAKVSAVHADVNNRVTSFDPKILRSQAQEVPTKAAARALEAAGRAEAAYEELAKRGKQLVDRVRSQASTQDLVNQAGNTLSRGRAAVTVARKAADDTASAILGTLSVGRREAGAVVEQTEVQVETAVKKTEASATRAAATTRKRAAATRSAAKGVETSATKTATKARTAAKTAAKKVGN
jgi:heparin binding hemagglutinin HbhA